MPNLSALEIAQNLRGQLKHQRFEDYWVLCKLFADQLAAKDRHFSRNQFMQSCGINRPTCLNAIA